MKSQAPVPARTRNAAALLPAIGVFLWMPPVITLFSGGIEVAGVPLIVAYLFGTWLLLIVCAALLTRRLGQRPQPPMPLDPPVGAPPPYSGPPPHAPPS